MDDTNIQLMEHGLLLQNHRNVFVETTFDHPTIPPTQYIKSPVPGLNRFSRYNSSYIKLREEYHNWLIDQQVNYVLKQEVSNGNRMIYLIAPVESLLLFKLAWF